MIAPMANQEGSLTAAVPDEALAQAWWNFKPR